MTREERSVDPYDLGYDEVAGLFADDELEVVTVDFRKRNWRRERTD